MKNYYFTFGYDSEHKGKYFVVIAINENVARELFADKFGYTFSSVYVDPEFSKLKEKYGWKELEL